MIRQYVAAGPSAVKGLRFAPIPVGLAALALERLFPQRPTEIRFISQGVDAAGGNRLFHL